MTTKLTDFQPLQDEVLKLRTEIVQLRAERDSHWSVIEDAKEQIERLRKERDDWKELAQLAISERRALENKPLPDDQTAWAEADYRALEPKP